MKRGIWFMLILVTALVMAAGTALAGFGPIDGHKVTVYGPVQSE